MRKIKFRAWLNEEAEMWEDLEAVGQNVFYYGESWHEIDENIVIMQFTGLLDKTGKEIYEFDLVRFDMLSSSCDVYGCFGVVKWFEGSFVIMSTKDEFMQDLIDSSLNKCVEVIGNTYEHSHLLTPTK